MILAYGSCESWIACVVMRCPTLDVIALCAHSRTRPHDLIIIIFLPPLANIFIVLHSRCVVNNVHECFTFGSHHHLNVDVCLSLPSTVAHVSPPSASLSVVRAFVSLCERNQAPPTQSLNAHTMLLLLFLPCVVVPLSLSSIRGIQTFTVSR